MLSGRFRFRVCVCLCVFFVPIFVCRSCVLRRLFILLGRLRSRSTFVVVRSSIALEKSSYQLYIRYIIYFDVMAKYADVVVILLCHGCA